MTVFTELPILVIHQHVMKQTGVGVVHQLIGCFMGSHQNLLRFIFTDCQHRLLKSIVKPMAQEHAILIATSTLIG